MVLLETPSNPLLGVTDIRAFSDIAHRGDAIVVVDNTVATPINQRPIDLGADLVWHSATKYLSGHSDVSAGVIAGRGDVMEQIWRTHLTLGSVLGPIDAWLLLRGIRTLDVRISRHNENAMALASVLTSHLRSVRCSTRSRHASAARSRQVSDVGLRGTAVLHADRGSGSGRQDLGRVATADTSAKSRLGAFSGHATRRDVE